MKNSSKPLVHIGYGKSGSTTLQSLFFPCHPDIDYYGIDLSKGLNNHEVRISPSAKIYPTESSRKLTSLLVNLDRFQGIDNNLKKTVAKDIEKGKANIGIVICGSGNGAAMTANKQQKVRAALCWTSEIAKLSREHNDANILSIPARFVTETLALEMVDIFIFTEFEGGRHEKRIGKIPCS